MRKIIWLLLTALLLSACSADSSRERVLRFVEHNQAQLEERIARQDYEGIGLPVLEVEVRESCIEFECGGSGFGSETAYWGFFYTEADDIYAVWCAPVRGSFTQAEEGVWYWEEPDGDNTCRVEHICGHFYYYHADF